MAFLGFATLGVLGKYQEGEAFAALDRLNDRPVLDGKCAWCAGNGFRKYICSPGSAPTHAGTPAGRPMPVVDTNPGQCDASWQHTHTEICGPCEGTGLAVELGVAG